MNKPVALLGLQVNISLNLMKINVDTMQELPTRAEGPNQSSNCMINGLKSTNSNVT